MIDWYRIRLKEWARHNQKVVIFGCGSETQHLMENEGLSAYFKDIEFCDNNSILHDKKFHDYDIVSPKDLNREVPVLVISSRHEDAIKKNLQKEYNIKVVCCLIRDLLLVDKEKALRAIDQESYPHLHQLECDVEDWDSFIKKQTSLWKEQKEVFVSLQPVLEESQIAEFLEKKYFCRCVYCGRVNVHEATGVDAKNTYIMYHCAFCENQWVRIHRYRNYNFVYIYLPKIDKIIFPNRLPHVKSPWWSSEDSAIVVLDGFSQYLKEIFLNQVNHVSFAGDARRQAYELLQAMDSAFLIISNRACSFWHTFFDEWVVLCLLMKRGAVEQKKSITLTAEFIRESSRFMTMCDNLVSFRTSEMSYYDAISDLNRYLLSVDKFVFVPVIKDFENNDLYNITQSMREEWFKELGSATEEARLQYKDKSPILFFYVRPYQQHIWHQQEDRIEKFIELFMKKYKNGLIILHGNSKCEEFYNKDCSWQKILALKHVVACIDKGFVEQYVLSKISTVGLFYYGGGMLWAKLTNLPFIEMTNSNLYKNSSAIVELVRDRQYDQTGKCDASKYTLMVDPVKDKDDKDYYFEPELVLNAVSCLLENIEKQKAGQ